MSIGTGTLATKAAVPMETSRAKNIGDYGAV
jgi:hypothetical protein